MAQWGNTDDAANSVLWATSQLNKPANTVNQTNLFGNTTADAFVTNATVGQFGVDAAEAQAARAGADTKAAHAGWVLRTEGSGGRAGRVFNEVLVAMASIDASTDAEDVVFADYAVRITTNPSNKTGSASGNISNTFTVAATTTPTGGSLSYLWYYSTDNSTFNTTAAVSGFSGQTTATLTANAATLGANVWVKAVVSAGGDSANTTVAKFTVTA